MSMGVYSDGSYGVPPGLIYSFPVTCEKGEWSIVQGVVPATLIKNKPWATKIRVTCRVPTSTLVVVTINCDNILRENKVL